MRVKVLRLARTALAGVVGALFITAVSAAPCAAGALPNHNDSLVRA